VPVVEIEDNSEHFPCRFAFLYAFQVQITRTELNIC
jgi:hypothetical protein